MKFRTIYEYTKNEDGITFKEPSLTQAQFADECDINKIMDRYLKTGVLSDPLGRSTPGTYGDFTEYGNYMENMNKVIEARNRFEMLPAAIRKRFGNDPQQMIEFVMDASNKEEAMKLGLLREDVSISEETEQTSTTEVSQLSAT